MSSYTYTDISPGFFEKAAEMFEPHHYSNKIIYKLLDIEKAPSAQGYEKYAYDIVVASNVLHATSSLQKTLEHVRQLLKPGGYLMLLEITNHGPSRVGFAMSGLPGWWVGKNDGRRYSPIITPDEWDSALQKAGFSGVDAVTPDINTFTWPLSVIASQAVDDRVNLLRYPLVRSTSAESIQIPSLVILGSKGLVTTKIAQDMFELLGGNCDRLIVLRDLPTQAEFALIDSTSTIVNLVDIEAPIFKEITEDSIHGLQRIYSVARNIVWVTVSALVDQPYHYASIAFNRVIANEYSHISMNHLDLSQIDDSSAKTIAEHVLRQFALEAWDADESGRPPLLWSRESEVFLEGDVLKISRIISDVDRNSRLNSTRRVVTKSVRACAPSNCIVWGEDLKISLIEDALLMTSVDSQSTIKVAYSSLIAIQVAPNTFLYVGVGADNQTREHVVALSRLNSRETVPVATAKTTKLTPGSLISVMYELLASSLVSSLPSYSSLLVHCSAAERFFAAALERKATEKFIRVNFCYEASSGSIHSKSWIGLRTYTPRHALRKQLKAISVTHYLDMSDIGALSVNIAQTLPPEHTRIQLHDIFRRQSSLDIPFDANKLTQVLGEAVFAAEDIDASEDLQGLVLPVEDLCSTSPFKLSIVAQWCAEKSIQVQTRALDPKRLFARNKTYLLVGLTGQVGQSLAEWMLANGAGCVCLASRNPKIDQRWMDSFKGYEGVAKTYSMDVTDKRGLEKVVKDIRATCSPIAGIVNGAMVLKDKLFSNMSAEAMKSVLGPKITGTNNLDRLFYDDNLDFFILLSSSACVFGNSGQSNYAAANGYLNSLARQRRRRGLAASTLDIGRLVGIGYVETADQTVVDQLNRFGLKGISESEMHHMFTESIHAGLPRLDDLEQIPEAVITTGIITVPENTNAHGPWLKTPRFAHCVIEHSEVNPEASQDLRKTSVSVIGKLNAAPDKDAAFDIIQDCFIAKLRTTLLLADREIDPNAALAELDLDSLVAVEVRSWFLKELKVDIPVLMIIGGASVIELAQRALDTLPEDLIGRIGTSE